MEVVQKIELPLTEHKTVKYTLYLCRSETNSTEPPSLPIREEPEQDQETNALPTMQELRQMRIEMYLSQRDAAQFLGIPQAELSRYERGESAPRNGVQTQYWHILEGCKSGRILYRKADTLAPFIGERWKKHREV